MYSMQSCFITDFIYLTKPTGEDDVNKRVGNVFYNAELLLKTLFATTTKALPTLS